MFLLTFYVGGTAAPSDPRPQKGLRPDETSFKSRKVNYGLILGLILGLIFGLIFWADFLTDFLGWTGEGEGVFY